MIKSVTFPEEGSGYIYEKVEKPEKPIKNSRFYREGSYEQAIETYKKEMAYYRKHKGEFITAASYNLVGKTFHFQDGKINVLFGPNASGKTTIIKSIVGNAMIDDGLTTFAEPLKFGFRLDQKEFELQPLVDAKKKNTSFVEWDGTPIYYDNFEYTKSNANGIFGAMVGSALQSLEDEIEYHLTSKSISAGQNSMYIMGKIMKIVSKPFSMKSICEGQLEKFARANDLWQMCGKANYEYFSKYERFESEVYPTLIFDEIDKSLDIATVWNIYTKFFPKIVEKYNNQIIMVSHSPLILTDKVFNNPSFNIISLDDKYTNSVKEMLKNVRF